MFSDRFEVNSNSLSGLSYKINMPSARKKVGDMAGGRMSHGWYFVMYKGRLYSCATIVAILCKIDGYKELLDNISKGDMKSLVVDHLDGNSDNNTPNNFEIIKFRDNVIRSRKGSKGGYYWNKERNKWQAQAMINGKQIYLGRFENESDARSAYEAAVTNEMVGK